MSILAIDSGNSRVKWGLYDGRRWTATGAVGRQETVRLNDTWKSLPPPTKIVVSNVAGELIRSGINVLISRWRVAPQWVIAKAQQCGVTNGYEQPAQLGCDRWAALIGARQLHKGAAIVVLAGTANTMDAMTADGKFLGGLILPGFDMMVDSLSSKTAGIRAERGEFQVFPTNTRNAVWSAAIQATIGAYDRMQDAMIEIGHPPPAVLLSGGAAEAIEPWLKGPITRVDNLILEGLACIAAEAK